MNENLPKSDQGPQPPGRRQALPDLDGVRYSRGDLLRRVGRIEQVAGIRLVTLEDGAERGVRVLEFRTGTGFEFDVIVDRAFDIGRCEHSGRSLAWMSPTGFSGPWFYEPEGLGFLRSFGAGLLTTCGLDHAFAPADDTAAQYHYPAKPSQAYGLHGRLSGRPARLAAYGHTWSEDECVLYAEGEVLQAAVFGEQLLLRRRIEARLGESRLWIRDEVVNIGHDRTPHMFLYHVNLGWPVVDDGSQLLAPATSVQARGSYPAEGYRRMHAPQRGYVEQVFEHELAETGGRVPVAVVNRRIGLGAYQIFRQDQLPHHFIWRMLGEGTYVIGIEPATNRPTDRHDARARGELIELEPGEARRYELELGALAGDEAISRFAEHVDALASASP
jgi:hypothetical protein